MWALLDRRIDLIPSLPHLYLSVVCPVIHLAHWDTEPRKIFDSPSPARYASNNFSANIVKGHVPNVVEFYSRTHSDDHRPETPFFTPTSSLFQICLDVSTQIVRMVDGHETNNIEVEYKWISSTYATYQRALSQ